MNEWEKSKCTTEICLFLAFWWILNKFSAIKPKTEPFFWIVVGILPNLICGMIWKGIYSHSSFGINVKSTKTPRRNHGSLINELFLAFFTSLFYLISPKLILKVWKKKKCKLKIVLERLFRGDFTSMFYWKNYQAEHIFAVVSFFFGILLCIFFFIS